MGGGPHAGARVGRRPCWPRPRAISPRAGEHGNGRMQGLREARQVRAAHGPGHDDVGEEHVDPLVLVQDGSRRIPVVRPQHAIAQLRQHIGRGGLDREVVLDHEHRFRAARDLARRHVEGLFFGPVRARQVDLDCRARTDFAVDLDVATALLDEAKGHGEAEARALALAPGGEEVWRGERQWLRARRIRHEQAVVGTVDRRRLHARP
ncbi:MAG: hypothetical protein JWP72_1130 [Massilia sp.]|nr:hypothetical protein [Massilia sp.]MDB5792010.1 hypothetical protein [Massilia sp.]